METLFCPTCKEEKEYFTELKSNQNTARCIICNTFIKNIPYQKPSFWVGKYKGKPIDEIQDLDYLKWAIQKMNNLNKRTKDAVSQQILKLEFEAK